MVRRTRSQDKVLAALEGVSKPISAQALYVELRQGGDTMGLATVYRALDALKLEGSVQMRTLPSGEALYSLPQEDRHHLTCLQCGNTIAINQCPVHDLEQQLHKAHEFKIFYHTLEFFGLCPGCQGSLDMAQPSPDEHGCDTHRH